MNSLPIAITLGRDDLARLDGLADSLDTSRSAVVRGLLRNAPFFPTPEQFASETRRGWRRGRSRRQHSERIKQ